MGEGNDGVGEWRWREFFTAEERVREHSNLCLSTQVSIPNDRLRSDWLFTLLIAAFVSKHAAAACAVASQPMDKGGQSLGAPKV